MYIYFQLTAALSLSRVRCHSFFGGSSLVLEGATVTEGIFVGGRCLLLCGAYIGAKFTSDFMGASVGCNLGYDTSSEENCEVLWM